MTRARIHRTSQVRGFSMIEMLIALAISASLLTATLAALRASFIQYKVTTESASTHVVTRIVMHRMLSMIRTGSDFGPFPADVLDQNENPLTSDFIEFVTQRDMLGGIARITRLEYRDPGVGETAGSLWYVLLDPALVNPSDPDAAIVEEHMLLSGVQQISFMMHYDIGPRLSRCTIDMLVEPNDSEDMVVGAVGDPAEAQFIRLIASAAPRQLM
jgi:prepilin-type N-terminal cleavage/methylation domain-containing protein